MFSITQMHEMTSVSKPMYRFIKDNTANAARFRFLFSILGMNLRDKLWLLSRHGNLTHKDK